MNKDTTSRTRLMGVAMVLLALVPSVCIAYLSWSQITQARTAYRTTRTMHFNGLVIRTASKLTHALQTERGVTAWHTAGRISDNTSILSARSDTDNAVASFRDALATARIEPAAIDRSADVIEQIARVRDMSDNADQHFWKDEFARYTEIIAAAQAAADAAPKAKTDRGIGKVFAKVVLIQHARESAGRLCGMLSAKIAGREAFRQSEIDALRSDFEITQSYTKSPMSQLGVLINTGEQNTAVARAWADLDHVIAQIEPGHALDPPWLHDPGAFFSSMTLIVDANYKDELQQLAHLDARLTKLGAIDAAHFDGAIIWGAVGIASVGVIFWFLFYMRRTTLGARVAHDEAQNHLRDLAQTRAALDLHAIVAVTDPDGVITHVNDKFCQISGYSREKLVGNTHRLLDSGTHPDSFFEAIWRTIRSGKVYNGVIQYQSSDGWPFWADTTIAPFYHRTGVIKKYITISTDVSASKHNEEALRDARSLAESANDAKSMFLANMSHEIRSPMTAILGYAEMLAEAGDRNLAPPKRLEAIDTIHRNGKHLLELINDILDLSKIESGKLTTEQIETCPACVVEDVLSLMRVGAASKNLRLESVYQTPMPLKISTDPVRLRQIITNLVSNAIRFTESGGVQVHCHLDRPDSDSPELRFEVVDTGIGIQPDKIGMLFKAFSQADESTTRKFGGSGLGLRICKQLAHRLKGNISVESVPDEGSVFTLTLPTGDIQGVQLIDPKQIADRIEQRAAAKAMDNQRKTDNRAASRPLDGFRLLVAEDGPDNQVILRHFLTKAGASVDLVENGQDAIEHIEQHDASGTPFDIILMDMQMPVLDGYHAASTLRDRGCTLPIVALTAHAMPGDREKCIDAGCTDYVSKPIDRTTLIETCQRLVLKSTNTNQRKAA